MVLTLYHFPVSGPSRGALLAARAVGVEVDIQEIDLFKKEQLKPDFIKINPQHTVPTLVDGDFILWDGHAIATYLATVYAKDDSLYPKDPIKRAIVDSRLQFDCGTLYPRLRKICFPIIYLGEDQIYDEDRAPLDEALGFLDVFLEGNNFVAGDKLTVADCSLISSVSSIEAIGIDLKPYNNVSNWMARCKLEIPDYEQSNQVGANLFGKEVKKRLSGTL